MFIVHLQLADEKMRLFLMGLFCKLFLLVESCNEANCGSIVSKCLLTKACSCDLTTKLCSKDCFKCLGLLYTECCGCVDMCPSEADPGTKSTQSQVEDFRETDPGLFNVLTEDPDILDRWEVEKYPIKINMTEYLNTKVLNIQKETDAPTTDQYMILNCTVVFWSQCMSLNKCKNNCLSMGSASYRWFYDGCCECVGQQCINYGMNVSSCRSCPLLEDDNTQAALDESEFDYGEDSLEDDY